jgi:hypothetical protein
LGIDPQRLPGETRMFFDDDEYELMERRLLAAEDQPADIGDDPVLDERGIFARPVRAFPASWHYFCLAQTNKSPTAFAGPKTALQLAEHADLRQQAVEGRRRAVHARGGDDPVVSGSFGLLIKLNIK